jgi:hypothetical protein
VNARLTSILAGALCAGQLLAAEPATNPPPVTKYFLAATPADAKVVTATFLGGAGHEWLVGGGWQPDGAVILAGNDIGLTDLADDEIDVRVGMRGTFTPGTPPARAE